MLRYYIIQGVGKIFEAADVDQAHAYLYQVLTKLRPESKPVLRDWLNAATEGDVLCVIDRIVVVTTKDIDVITMKLRTDVDTTINKAVTAKATYGKLQAQKKSQDADEEDEDLPPYEEDEEGDTPEEEDED